jgi:hypothetical protein
VENLKSVNWDMKDAEYSDDTAANQRTELLQIAKLSMAAAWNRMETP